VSVTTLDLWSDSRLELGTGRLSVAANGFDESTIRSKLIAGYNGGSWDGSAGITSNAAGSDRAIGYRVADDGSLELGYSAPGDSNLDGIVDILDITTIVSGGKYNTGEPANWEQGDTNYDGVFDILDIGNILSGDLYNNGPYLPQPIAAGSSAAIQTLAAFDPAVLFAAYGADSNPQTPTKRRLA